MDLTPRQVEAAMVKAEAGLHLGVSLRWTSAATDGERVLLVCRDAPGTDYLLDEDGVTVVVPPDGQGVRVGSLWRCGRLVSTVPVESTP